MLKIYGVPNSQPVRAVVWTCLMKELPFEFVMTSQNRDAKQPEFLASVNPRGTIPAIDDDGTVLWESHAILIYLCEKHGWTDLWPSAPEERAKVNQYLHFHHRNTRELVVQVVQWSRAIWPALVADTFGVRGDITFETEVRSLAWDEAASMWDITVDGPEGRRTLRSNAVITAVGFLNRPNMPEIPGMERFHGPSWHSARWPAEFDPKGKRVAVIGTGCTGYQMVPELALEAGHVTVFQRTPQWLFGAPGYRSPFPSQVPWLDRNLPYHTNFMRLRIASGFIAGFGPLAQVDPHFQDEHATSRINKVARDNCIAFLKEKLGDPDLLEKMTPEHPVLSARPVLVDPEYSILDAIQRDTVTLVTDGIRGITEAGVETEDGKLHEVDAIVYATGFKATEYLFPMSITGRGGRTVEELWSQTGAQGYLGAMIPGCPNLWTLYGPNTNGGLLIPAFQEMETCYALKCIERLILDDRKSIDVKEEPYRRYNEMLDERNRCMAWSDARAQNYYWTKFGRSATQNPLTPLEVWNALREPDFADLDVR